VRFISLAAFVQQSAMDLTRFAYLITGDRGRAEDLVQDALLSMHRRFGADLVAVDNPAGYARRAIVNAHISAARRGRIRELLTDRLPDVPARTADEPDDDVWRAVTRLPARQRATVVMRYYLGYSDRDIAEILGCRESSVRSLAARAFQALRPVLGSTS
jgi:RNA polymerase sigma-70 factor (sigma-E family)